MNKKYCIFSYGSNSISQLRGRLNNLSLKSYPAYINGYKRIFCQYSKYWKGGIASLIEKKYTKTFGIVVYLNEDELSKLDSYEINYTKKELGCVIIKDYDDEDYVNKRCLVYISNDNSWIDYPSQQYLIAIKIMLNEHYFNSKLTKNIIISGLFGNKIINLKKFYYPKDNKTLNLESLFLIVNSLRENPWPMPKTINEITLKLYSINIINSYDLIEYLNKINGINILNLKLKNASFNEFSFNTFILLEKVLLNS
jgi:cation transport regulator ChaC